MTDESKDRELWRRYRRASGDIGVTPKPDAQRLAAYLDGTLNREAATDVEAFLGDQPGWSDILTAGDSQSYPAPSNLVRAAQAIAGTPPRHVSRVPGLSNLWRSWIPGPALAFACALPAVALAAYLGLVLGAATHRHQATAMSVATTDLFFGPEPAAVSAVPL